jgi:hypothetical protein
MIDLGVPGGFSTILKPFLSEKTNKIVQFSHLGVPCRSQEKYYIVSQNSILMLEREQEL